MKTLKLLLSLSILLSASIQLMAQTGPYEGFNYQGIARDASGDPIANQSIGVKIELLYAVGIVYAETHSTTTDARGLFTLKIGTGTTAVPGAFDQLSWNDNSNWAIRVSADFTGGTNYQPIGNPENLVSVPFAKAAEVAKTAETAQGLAGGAFTVDTVNKIIHSDPNYKVGIGTDNPFSTFDVNGEVSIRSYLNLYAGIFWSGWDMIGTPGSFVINEGNVGAVVSVVPGGNMAVGPNTPATGAALDVQSTTGAFMPPRLTTAQRDALSPLPGMMIYNTDAGVFQGVHEEFSDSTSAEFQGPIGAYALQMVHYPNSNVYPAGGQSFVAAKSGKLQTIITYGSNWQNSPGFTFKVLDGLPNDPSAQVIAQEHRAPGTLLGTVNFTQHPMLISGNTYSFVMESDTVGFSGYWEQCPKGTVPLSNPDLYPGGVTWRGSITAGGPPPQYGIVSHNGLPVDMKFKVIVETSETDWTDLH